MIDMSFIKDVFTVTFIVRWILSSVTAAVTAWLVSFAVADYVVKANTTSLATALENMQSSNSLAMTSLQQSIEALNTTVRDNVSASQGLSEQISSLSSDSAVQLVRLDTLKDDVSKVQEAIQEAGIPIRANWDLSDVRPSDWKVIREGLELQPGQDLLIDAETWSEMLQRFKLEGTIENEMR